ncbi:CBS domain-containing protein [Paenibacillus sp. y28]|uniref:CBS domain-containing protein n=1 Tax=Paenibacillus sp. y28 TaxID=3129110 RepID=UPI0030182129
MDSRKIREIMTDEVTTVTRKDNIYEIAVKMKQLDTGFIPVVEGKKLIGVVTDRDLVVRGYAEKHSGSTSVEEVMSKSIDTISPEDTVDEAARKMAGEQVRRLPVVENGELVGVVSIGDLAVRQKFEDEAGEALSKISEQNQLAGTKK